MSKDTRRNRGHGTCLPYASVVGSLMYEMVWTGPDNSHAMGVLR
jgi:hypothetical protein